MECHLRCTTKEVARFPTALLARNLSYINWRCSSCLKSTKKLSFQGWGNYHRRTQLERSDQEGRRQSSIVSSSRRLCWLTPLDGDPYLGIKMLASTLPASSSSLRCRCCGSCASGLFRSKVAG